MYNLTGKRIWVAGHNGMVGGAVARRLQSENCTLLTVAKSELNLIHQAETDNWIRDNKPDVIILAAARVGGIGDNAAHKASYLYENAMMAMNVIHAAAKYDVECVLNLGSACIYPREVPQPIVEDALLSAPLEPTNEGYALAKIAALKLCEYYAVEEGRRFISAMPCNLYGPGDRFDLARSHVIPALIMKAHAAKEKGEDAIEIWGTGSALREFLYVEDLADALVTMLQHYDGAQHINIGSGEECSILDLATMISEVVGLKGEVRLDATKPDGTPRRILESSKIKQLGWAPKTDLQTGLEKTYAWYLNSIA